MYAYLQSGQEARAAAVIEEANAAMTRYGAMPGMAPDHYMTGMFPYYRAKLPVFFALDTRDWHKALELAPVADAPPETQTQVEWAHAIAAGHLHRAADAAQALSSYDALIAEIRRGRHAYYAEGTAPQIRRGEIVAWSRFAAGDTSAALEAMRAAADLQDRVGQGEVDVPAREMLADMLLDARRPADALFEYRADLQLSPKRFNGLYGAAQAAEAAGDGAAAREFYGELLASTADGAGSTRAEIAHAKAFLSQLTMTPRESSAQN